MRKSDKEFTEQNLFNIKKLFYDKLALNEPPTITRSDSSFYPPVLYPSAPSAQTKKSMNKRKRYRKAIYIPVTAALSLCLVTGAAASMGIIDLPSILHFLGADRIGILQSVHQVSEDQGIRMEVIGAVRDGDTTEIYVSLSDLTGQRIDETLDVYDYRVTGGNANNAQIIHYDEANKTAIVRFLIQGKVSKNRITVQINTLMSGTSLRDGYNVQVDWEKLFQEKQNNNYDIVDQDRISGLGGKTDIHMENDPIPVLHQDVTNVPVSGIDWMHISNMGFVDGKLHIQINPDNEIGEYNHGYFYFTDEQGRKLDIPEYSVSYGHYMKDGVGYGGDYEEFVYDLSAVDELDKLRLQGSFTSISEVVQGNWKTTFNLSQNGLSKTGNVQLDANGASQANVTLSAVGVTLTGEARSKIRMENLSIEVHLKDGTKLTGKSGFLQLDQDLIKWISPKTIPVNDVSYLLLNGEKVTLQDR
ncbi:MULTISPECIES: DUF4179 domain-containing protein [unclassified Paenibacillus]|uniref:DUF4179 domain-containing protein n=1 Tax=unclassified Paenibacillus TaxID=185978 RepID=UPI000CFD94CD|nr:MULTISPECIES: DUF4179 domain-containing protein [unclassified Paenibacillus]PRA07900.1 hypothetical protein CQ043_11195 [Paenibacillus sp. MYb63]PRA48023.1 hypothetical protein CQ061_15635 [Paenibacillus sp. MYb67]QZN74571.1 DUF4179 domain-containing protein [Paenibacillus sp. DR312]